MGRVAGWLQQRIDAVVRASELSEDGTDRVRIREMCSGTERTRSGCFERGRVGQGENDRAIAFQQPVSLAKHATKIFDRGERVHGQHRVEAVGVEEGEIGEVRLMRLDVNLGRFRSCSRRGHFLVVWVEGDHASTLARQRDGGATGATAKIEDPESVDVAQESAIESIDLAGTELDMIDRALGPECSRGCIATPLLHERDSTFPVRWAT